MIVPACTATQESSLRSSCDYSNIFFNLGCSITVTPVLTLAVNAFLFILHNAKCRLQLFVNNLVIRCQEIQMEN